MGLSRAYLLIVWLSAGLFSLGCMAKPNVQVILVSRVAKGPNTNQAGTKPKTILVIMPATPQADNIWEGMRDELSSEFDIVAERFAKDVSVDAIGAAIRKTSPVCIVLMNNSIARAYRRYQRTRPSGTAHPPTVVVMSSFLQQTVKSIKNATGISYEVPGVVQFVKLRSIVQAPVRKVGVVYRSQFADFIAAQRDLAGREQFEVVGREVGGDPSPGDVSAALTTLLERDRIDALWVLNDNRLLSPQMISTEWLPILNRHVRVPVIVGVPSLVSSDYPVGTFAMLPDHVALGMQTANLVFDLADSDWQIGTRKVALPISIKTVVDVKEVGQFGLKGGGLDGVDQVLVK